MDHLARWRAAAGGPRQVVCLGDSMTRAFEREPSGRPSPSWVDLLAFALGAEAERLPAEGFRGMWRGQEWTREGAWTKTEPDDPFDHAPFGEGYFSSRTTVDTLVWKRPRGAPVSAFALYWLALPGGGAWQYRVDGGPWHTVDPDEQGAPDDDATTGPLRRLFVDEAVQERVTVRGGVGDSPSVVGLAGIDVYGRAPHAPVTRVHHLGLGMQFLGHLCRRSAGDPLALLDDLRPDLVIASFSNDVVFDDVDSFERSTRNLVGRVAPYADVLLVSGYEQRPPRRVDDAVTRSGSTTLRSEQAEFAAMDLLEIVLGADLPDQPPTDIRSVDSPTTVTLSAPATASSESSEVVIGRGREASTQAAYRAVTARVASDLGCAHLDIYEAWVSLGSTGWKECYDAGLVHDRYHASKAGHRDIATRVLALVGETGAPGVDELGPTP